MSKRKTSRGTAKKRGDEARLITAALLGRMPLPEPDEGGSKEERGRVLVVAGSPEMPGAAVLAAAAAARAGAGKLQVATAESVARLIAVTVPEARVFALPDADEGSFDPAGVAQIEGYLREARAVLVGPGMCGGERIGRVTRALLPHLSEDATLVLDADALNILADEPRLIAPLAGRAVLTPHATEMADVTGLDEEDIKRDPAAAVRGAVERFGAAVALKGRETYMAAPVVSEDGEPGVSEVYVNRAGNVGLATSGSGDTLAGLIAGLCARGASPLLAAIWGVHAHALAGDALARSTGTLGYLARELPGEFPRVLTKLGAKRRR